MLSGIAIGDLHLDKLTKVLGTQANQLKMQHLNRALEYAATNGINNVFILGDIGDKSRISYDGHKWLLRTLAKWDGILNIHIYLGNHDVDETEVHSLELLVLMYQELNAFKTTKVYSKPEQILIEGVMCNILPYPHINPIPYKKPTLNFGHFEVNGATRDNGGSIRNDVDPDPNCHYIVGHLHTPHSIGRVHYTGTLYQLNFGESLPKGFTHFRARYVEDRLEVKYRRIEQEPIFTFTNLIIESKRDLNKVDSNPLHLYKIFVEDGVDIPDSIMVDKPNIIKRQGYSTREELEILVHENLLDGESGQTIPDLNIKNNLCTILVSKGFTNKQVKRALGFVDTVNMG